MKTINESHELVVIEKPDSLPDEAVVELIHKSYAYWIKPGVPFAALDLSPAQFRQKLDKGTICMTAFVGDKLVGTMSYKHVQNSKKKWYRDTDYIKSFLSAVDPQYQGHKISLQIKRAIDERFTDKNYRIMDTAAKANHLIEFYQRIGGQLVDYVSWPNTSYYSCVFRTPINGGKDLNEHYCKFRFTISKLLCILQYREHGGLRLPFRIFYAFKKRLKKY